MSFLIILPFRTPVIIISFNIRLWFLETDIIKTGKRCPTYVFNRMIRHQKMFFPSHINKIRISQGFVVKIIRIEGFCILTKRSKFTLKILLKTHRQHSCEIVKYLKFTQCFLSTSSSASHFLVKNGYFWLIISPSKNVVSVGYSSVRPFIWR